MVPEIQAKNAIQWIEKMQKTQCKKQSCFMGNLHCGYSIIGFGAKTLGIEFFPDDVGNAEFTEAVGLHSDDGKFYTPLRYKYTFYSSLSDISTVATFRMSAVFMKKIPHLRSIFKPAVAAIMVEHFKNKSDK